MSKAESKSRAKDLAQGQGWPLIAYLFEVDEWANLLRIRNNPDSPQARVAAVKLAHIEELRNAYRELLPGDPFDAPTSYGPAGAQLPEPEPEPEPDDYDLYA